MYFPKNKIETGLYSAGGFQISSTKKVYYGPYFKTSTGACYTGKEPNDGPNEPLEALTESNTYKNSDSRIPDYRYLPGNKEYTILTKQPKTQNVNLPIPYYPQPTEGDYRTGEFRRYFAKKANENIYYEVADLRVESNPMYRVFSLQWKISGDKGIVATINKNTVKLYMERLDIPAFNQYLKNDYLKFWKPS